MAIDGTERILQLLSLLSSRRSWTGSELAERLGTTGRTVRRDVDRLRLLGYQIDGTRGADGGYSLSAGADLPPLFLDDDEAVAVVVALLLAGNRSTGMDDSTTRALAKLHHVMPAPLLRRLAAVHAATRVLLGADAPQVDPRTVAALAEATRDRTRVTFAYRSREGAATTRRVDPYTLVTPGRVWYLAAFDLDRDDWRVFRVDRMSSLVTTGHTFELRTAPGGDPALLVGQAIARTPMRHHARVVLPLGADTLRAERPTLLAERITTLDATSCAVALADEDADALVRLIADLLQVAPGGTVETDDEVVRRLDDLAAALSGAVARPPSPKPARRARPTAASTRQR